MAGPGLPGPMGSSHHSPYLHLQGVVFVKEQIWKETCLWSHASDCPCAFEQVLGPQCLHLVTGEGSLEPGDGAEGC